MSLPPLKRHDISIEEALTLLAWDTTFTTSNFQAADGLASNREMLAFHRKRLADIETEYEQKKADALQKNPEEGSDTEAIVTQLNASTDIQTLVYSWQSAKDSIEQYSEAILEAEHVLPKIEAASGGYTYCSDDFFRGLVLAQGHLWEAIKAGTVVAHAKKDRADQEWQQIPKRWFWDDPQPTCNLGMGWIQREKQYSRDGITCWIEVRFERPEIEALRNRLLNAEPAPTNNEPLKSGTPGRPTSMHLVLAEFRRKKEAQILSSSVKAEAEFLAEWIKSQHPEAPKITAKTIENKIREEYRSIKPP